MRHSGAYLLAAALLATAFISCQADTLQPIIDGEDPKWDPDSAHKEILTDVKNLIVAFDRDKHKLDGIYNEFSVGRVKDVGIRKLALWGISLARVHDLVKEEAAWPLGDAIYARMKDMAEKLLSLFESKHSYVEDKTMRGWSMIVDPRDKFEIHEAYNFGHIGMAIAECARATAELGNHQEAMNMLRPVLIALYDGYLTPDRSRSKLSREGLVVYVPSDAPYERSVRQVVATEGSSEKCISEPQAYNHGLLVARAAMAAEMALAEILKGDVVWPISVWTPHECREQLEWLVHTNAEWLKSAMRKQSPTGSDERDNYMGPDGQDWYQWDYRDLSNCEELQGTVKDRRSDIAHSTFDVNFVAESRAWADHLGLNSVFKIKDVHRLVVTFLNRLVYDYDAPSDQRFACDVAGVIDGADWGNAEKQCGSSFRIPEKRAKHAMGWMNLAQSVWSLGDDEGDPLLHCDVLQMASLALPLALPDSADFDEYNFAELDQSWAAEAIQAKYYFYNFRNELIKDCPDRQVAPS